MFVDTSFGAYRSTAPELVYFLIAYSAFGTFVTVKGFGTRSTLLKFQVTAFCLGNKISSCCLSNVVEYDGLSHVQAVQREANFRYTLVRVRYNVESIALPRWWKP